MQRNEYLNIHSYIYSKIGVVRELVATFNTTIYLTYDFSKFLHGFTCISERDIRVV